MILLFLHGWGFDRSIWAAVAAALPGFDCRFADRGYFAEPIAPALDGPVLAIGHSLGALLLLRQSPAGLRGLVAINGFDWFTGRGGEPGVPVRIVDRMVTRFAETPAAVLDEFRARCGAPAAGPAIDRVRLGEDLALLRDADERPASTGLRAPLLVLHGGADPILPPGLRDTSFAGAAAAERALAPDGGHLLPVTHAAWCAARLRRFAETCA